MKPLPRYVEPEPEDSKFTAETLPHIGHGRNRDDLVGLPFADLFGLAKRNHEEEFNGQA